MEILTYPNPVLRKKSQKVENFSDLKKFIKQFVFMMKKYDGIGLAAPQVGKAIQLVAVQTKDGAKIFINPQITKKSFKKEIAEEGCLSLPKIFKNVKRPYKITIKYQDEQGNKHTLTEQGLYARVLQHEIDHLQGILFIDKAIK